MANREELQLLRQARANHPEAQLQLGKLYLFGTKSLPQSLTTALHWLSRAASQNNKEACILIGDYIPYEIAKCFPDQFAIQSWYKNALAEGHYEAGLVLARLILSSPHQIDDIKYTDAIHILETIADHDIAEAQWLLAELAKGPNARPSIINNALKWTARAADAGIVDAQIALIEHAWENQDYSVFLQHALPIARSIIQADQQGEAVNTDEQSARLLFRCGQLLLKQHEQHSEEIQSMWEVAARQKNADAAFSLGLWYARMDENGKRVNSGATATSFKKAIRWLSHAGEQGLSKAWYALSLIYQKAEFSQRNMTDAQRYLEMAADLGHATAQFERGMHAWRARREDESNDIKAVYWLQKASGNGKTDAANFLNKIAMKATPAPWAVTARQCLTHEILSSHPFLAARIELAAIFGLSRPEALLLDIHNADKGHCLLVDIREFYRRSKRKLILIQTGQERQILSRISRLFEKVDCGLNGPEGNYRQRQYRLKTMLPTAWSDTTNEEERPEIAET